MRRLAAMALLAGGPLACDHEAAEHASPTSASPSVPAPAPPAPVSLPGLPRVLTFTDRERGAGTGLPVGCRLDLPVRVATLPEGDVRFLAPDDGSTELAFAESVGEGEARGGLVVVGPGRTAVRPFPWAALEDPPVAARASGGWLGALVEADRAGLDALVLWRERRSPEILAEGDQLVPWGATCDEDACALLSTRVSRSAGSGASVFRGAYGAAARTWQRADVQPSAKGTWSPMTILSHRKSHTDVALATADQSQVEIWRVGPDEATRVAGFASIHEPYALVPAEVPVLIEAGTDDTTGCTGERFPLVFRSAKGETHEARIAAAPSSLAVRPVGGGFIVVWVGPMNCRDADRFVVHALLTDGRGVPVTSPMAVTRSVGFAVTTQGDALNLWLHLGEEMSWVRARCTPGPAAAALPAPSVSAPAGSAFKSGAK